MSSFITQADYLTYIRDANLTRLIEGNAALLEDAEATAIATVRDSLFQYYKVDDLFALTGAARPKQVVRWVVTLALYYLYERLPAAVMPDRAKSNYDQVTTWLGQIEDGRKSLDLPHELKSDGETSTSKFRWGFGEAARSHYL